MQVKSLVLLSVIVVVIIAGLLQSFVPPPKPVVIGIDLGTTHSCAALFQSGTGDVIVMRDENGHALIPSVVGFYDNGKILIGREAMALQDTHSNTTIFDVKRIIGQTYDSVQAHVERYPFKIINDSNVPKIVTSQGSFAPEEVSAHVLAKLKSITEKYLEKELKGIVIGVPVEFSEEQRNATQRAADLAGLPVLRMISEPTAAAIAYGVHQQEEVHLVVVFDFGGGTLDVSVLSVEDRIFETLAIGGDERLGGEDLNQALIDFYQTHLEQEYNCVLETSEQKQSLRKEVERMKLELSAADSTLLDLKLFCGSRSDHTETLKRERFEELIDDLMQRMLKVVADALEEVNITTDEIDQVILVGGSTRVPRVRKLLEEMFGQVPNTSVQPEQAVAIGAAVQAGILTDSWPVPVAAVEKPFKKSSG